MKTDIENVSLKKPLLLVEADHSITKGSRGLFSVRVFKIAKDSEYKKEDIIIIDPNMLVQFILDDEIYENIYLLNETVIKGDIKRL